MPTVFDSHADTPLSAYIYVFTNNIVGHSRHGWKYIGKAMNEACLKRRLVCHTTSHGNRLLSRDIKKYGISSFIIEEIEFNVDNKAILGFEQEFILKFNTLHPNGYNFTTGGEGGIVSEETKKKATGKTRSKETRKRMSIARKGKGVGVPRSEETKKKISLAQIGRPRPLHSEETKKKMSVSRLGIPCSEETRRKISIAKTGKQLGPLSEETKRKVSIGMKLYHQSKRGII